MTTSRPAEARLSRRQHSLFTRRLRGLTRRAPKGHAPLCLCLCLGLCLSLEVEPQSSPADCGTADCCTALHCTRELFASRRVRCAALSFSQANSAARSALLHIRDVAFEFEIVRFGEVWPVASGSRFQLSEHSRSRVQHFKLSHGRASQSHSQQSSVSLFLFTRVSNTINVRELRCAS